MAFPWQRTSISGLAGIWIVMERDPFDYDRKVYRRFFFASEEIAEQAAKAIEKFGNDASDPQIVKKVSAKQPIYTSFNDFKRDFDAQNKAWKERFCKNNPGAC